MNKRHYEHTLPNIRGSLSNTYVQCLKLDRRYHKPFVFQSECKDTDIFVMYITKILKY